MTKAEYSELLKRPAWRKKRAKILHRDSKKCVKCKSSKRLEVHHVWYIEGNLPWNVPDEYLLTLCSDCHRKEHEDRPIHTFIKQSKKAKKLQRKQRGIRKSIAGNKKRKQELGGKDKLIQDRYNSLRARGIIK